VKKPAVRLAFLLVLLTQELQDSLGLLVGLREHGLGGLGEDAHLGELHHLFGHVHVPDAGLGCAQVFTGSTQVVDGVLQPVLGGAHLGPFGGNLLDGVVDGGNNGVGGVFIGH